MELLGSGHVGGQEQKQFSSLGTKLRFHKKFCKKNVIVLTTIVAVMSDGWEPRIMQLSMCGLLENYFQVFLDLFWMNIGKRFGMGRIRCCGVKVNFTKFYLSDVVTCLFSECCRSKTTGCF